MKNINKFIALTMISITLSLTTFIIGTSYILIGNFEMVSLFYVISITFTVIAYIMSFKFGYFQAIGRPDSITNLIGAFKVMFFKDNYAALQQNEKLYYVCTKGTGMNGSHIGRMILLPPIAAQSDEIHTIQLIPNKP